MLKPKQMNYESQIAFGQMGEGVEVLVENAADKYENGLDSDEIWNSLVQESEALIGQLIDRGKLDRYIDDEEGYFVANDISYDDIATILYNYLVDELNAPDDLPYRR